jgi:hypothetical protein
VLTFSIRNRRRKAQRILTFMRSKNIRSVVLSGALGSGSQTNESIIKKQLSKWPIWQWFAISSIDLRLGL